MIITRRWPDPAARSASQVPIVPLATATPMRRPTQSANIDSKASTSGPRPRAGRGRVPPRRAPASRSPTSGSTARSGHRSSSRAPLSESGVAAQDRRASTVIGSAVSVASSGSFEHPAVGQRHAAAPHRLAFHRHDRLEVLLGHVGRQRSLRVLRIITFITVSVEVGSGGEGRAPCTCFRRPPPAAPAPRPRARRRSARVVVPDSEKRTAASAASARARPSRAARAGLGAPRRARGPGRRDDAARSRRVSTTSAGTRPKRMQLVFGDARTPACTPRRPAPRGPAALRAGRATGSRAPTTRKQRGLAEHRARRPRNRRSPAGSQCRRAACAPARPAAVPARRSWGPPAARRPLRAVQLVRGHRRQVGAAVRECRS